MMPQEIHALRKRLDLSQLALARVLGVCRRTILRWEKGHHPPRPVSVRMLKALAAGRLTEFGWAWEEKP